MLSQHDRHCQTQACSPLYSLSSSVIPPLTRGTAVSTSPLGESSSLAMLCSTRPVFRSVLTHPVRLRALWIFFFQVTPCRCLALQQRPLLRSLHRLSMSSSRAPVLTWRSSSRTLLSSRLGRLSAWHRLQPRPALPQLRPPLLHSGCTLGVGLRGFLRLPLLQLHRHLRPLLPVQQLRLLWRLFHRRLLRRLHRRLQSAGL